MIEFKKLPFSKEQVFFSSDTHFNHSNMCSATTRWDSGYRTFDSLEAMNKTIINAINERVGEDDCFIHAGDWSFGGINSIVTLRSAIRCKNIYLAHGNHDHHIRNNTLIKNGDSEIHPQDLFTQTFDIEYFRVEGQAFQVSHYPTLHHHQQSKESWMLFGHLHGEQSELLKIACDRYKMLDIGIDNHKLIYGTYAPFSFAEVEEYMKHRVVLKRHKNGD